MEGVINSKTRSRDPFTTPIGLILYCFSLAPLLRNLVARFEVSSFNCSRNMEGAQNSKTRSNDHLMTPLT